MVRSLFDSAPALDAASFACCLAYCMVSMSFLVLRKKMPDLNRPFKVKNYKFVGIAASVLSGMMVVLYLIPNSGCAMTKEEWIIVGGWALLGLVFFLMCKSHYKEKFGQMDV